MSYIGDDFTVSIDGTTFGTSLIVQDGDSIPSAEFEQQLSVGGSDNIYYVDVDGSSFVVVMALHPCGMI